jgi:hypothetical protein
MVLIDASNVVGESYFNLCRLADLLGYADPVAAIQHLRLTVQAEKDVCGNIIRADVRKGDTV